MRLLLALCRLCLATQWTVHPVLCVWSAGLALQAPLAQ
ncbi:hypothetical protein PF010_g32056 [Phytophthora fragariae]|nr:hypothetical protein PF006_g33193 [Phytophthora fragariae]KAE9055696.1 hypothetical protein PF010_g32056 [Phytophthora fragariae]